MTLDDKEAPTEHRNSLSDLQTSAKKQQRRSYQNYTVSPHIKEAANDLQRSYNAAPLPPLLLPHIQCAYDAESDEKSGDFNLNYDENEHDDVFDEEQSIKYVKEQVSKEKTAADNANCYVNVGCSLTPESSLTTSPSSLSSTGSNSECNTQVNLFNVNTDL